MTSGRRRSPGRRRSDHDTRAVEPEALVVDPDHDQRALIRAVLAADGFVVRSVRSGAHGLRAAVEFQPDLIVTELLLPTLDGVEFLKRLQSLDSTASIPLVVWTALADEASVTRARLAGATAVLTKPASPEALLEVISIVMRHADQAARHERPLRRVLMSLRRIAAHYAGDVAVRERLANVINRLQVAILMFDEQGSVLAASELAQSVKDLGDTVIAHCARGRAQAELAGPSPRDVFSASVLSDGVDTRHVVCVPAGIAGVHFAGVSLHADRQPAAGD